mmetsp:Transcript_23657/g.74959  ORF Transcript_23657/g.74959 Transcript_23657/m.74959 type:complete len:580 (+) Transcript_23657:85-1824(+)
MADDCTVPSCPTEGCHLTKVEGWIILLVLLAFFAILAVLAIPLAVKELRRLGYAAQSAEGIDFWYSARNSQSWPSIAFSICATSAGGWLLYTPSEAAVVGGWWALMGYCVAIASGPLVMCYLAPKFREQMPDSANVTDWVLQRFGLIPYLWVSLVLIYYMFIYLVGQLKTMGDMTTKFTGMIPEAGVIPLAIVTMLYTMLGGFPASIVTDWIQAGCILCLVLGVCVAVWGWVDIKSEHWEKVSVGSDRGFEMAVSLCFAVFGAEVFNLAFWQRIYAAKDDKELRIGFIVGAALVSFLTFLFGLTGMLLKAQDLGRTCPHNPIPAFVFFEVLEMPQAPGSERTNKGIRVLMYMLVVTMIASNADSFQTAITSTISRFLQQQKWSALKNVLAAEAFVLIVNIPAILFAVHSARDNSGADGLAVKLTDLFSMADILTITLVVPLFSGLWPYVTAYGSVVGMCSGLLFIVAWGWFEFGTFMGGLEMITMMCFGNTKPPPSENGAPGCGFYSSRAAVMFPLLPVVTGAFTFLVSHMERSWRKLSDTQRALEEAGILPSPCTKKVAPPAKKVDSKDSDDEDVWTL